MRDDADVGVVVTREGDEAIILLWCIIIEITITGIFICVVFIFSLFGSIFIKEILRRGVDVAVKGCGSE